MAANGITGDRIYVGQRLRLVPAAAAAATTATQLRRPLRRHAVDHRRRFGTTVRALQDANGIRNADLRHDRPHPEDPGGRHRGRRERSDARCRAAPRS